MAKCVHGEIVVDFHKNGNWQDLADILLLNGYSLEISMENESPFDNKGNEKMVIITIMTEVK